jgi:hypothetical protein
MKNIISEKLNLLFNTKSIGEVCATLNAAIENLRALKLLSPLPPEYQNIQIHTPEEIQEWFDQMKNEEASFNGGYLSEFYSLFSAALSQLREFGFHRNYA